MTKAQARRVLGVAATADREMVVQAYWHLARKHRAAAGRDQRARQRLDELNRAYLVLQPGSGEPPEEPEPVVLERAVKHAGRASTAELPLLQELLAWVRDVVAQTKARWRGRVPEITILTATTAVLGFLALSGGADGLVTVLTLGAAGLAIWAPWRQV